jgi:heme/copper-type cytochrome/quinol oxidase subunit 1
VPKLSVWFIRTALTYLGLGFTLGAIMLAHRGMPLLSPGVQLLPAHIVFLLVGWMVQLALGVGFWVLPRFRTGRERGREELAWLSYVLLNLGVLGSTVSSLVPLPAIMPLLGHLAQGLAAVCFALHAWPRIKAFGT